MTSTYPFDQRFLGLPKYEAVPQQQMTAAQHQKLDQLLAFIWPRQDLAAVKTQFLEMLAATQKRLAPEHLSEEAGWSERQLVLICYGDHIRSRDPKKTPLQALGEFFQQQFHEPEFSQLIIHLLPIYRSPYKDGGFDIADPFEVNPVMGTWDDVRSIRQHFHVAVDFVANHFSIVSEWFERYMHNDPLFKNFFIGFDDQTEAKRFELEYLPKIYRPRPHNPLIPVTKPDGSIRWVYMTFSDHQADVNYHDPFVFLKMLEVLLFYILQGASMVRLDAIPYLWKEWDTSCAHHPRTHALVELFRLAGDVVNPSVKLLAESMEPLADSQRYLSTGTEAKAHLAYDFVPCGLIPHTLLTENASVFQQILPNLLPPRKSVNWAVVCGVTHDGSSMNPCRAPKSVEGYAVLNESQINAVADYYTEHGYRELKTRMALDPIHPHALPPEYMRTFTEKHHEKPRFVNYKTIVDEQGQAQKIVYEAISTYGSLFDQQPEKIVAALSMGLGLPGIPFIYLTLPFALLNDFVYYQQTGNPRELNRGRVTLEDVLADLSDQRTLSAKVFSAYKRFLRLRVSSPAFHPDGSITPVSSENPAIFSFVRENLDATRRVLIMQNVSSAKQEVDLTFPEHLAALKTGRNLLSGKLLEIENRKLHLDLQPFAIQWMELK